ncbi:MAG: Fe2+-dependent dioxygenase [Pseudomonadota bacterium]|nr:Fe2+-dependent dioxygenase [Pseudomonadota bacterium]
MLLVIEQLLPPTALAQVRALLAPARWHDGRETAGYTAAALKSNEQLRADDPAALQAGQLVLGALAAHPRFISFALPLKILPPMFNRYAGGGAYGFHIDNAIRTDSASGQRIRTDLSTTVFLSDPQDYDGGELIIEDTYGQHPIKLPAGHAVVYPGTSVHRVSPVTRGQRLAAFFWTQSLVPHDSQRALLFDLDTTIQRLAQRPGNAEDVTRLSGTYHNLLRHWAQT